MDDPGDSTHSSSSSSEKHTEDPHLQGHKATQCSLVSVYHANLAGATRNVTVSWSKTLINHSLSVSLERLDGGAPLGCKVDLKPWPFWSKKGFKSLELDHRRVDVFWDFRSAKFSSRPEPSGGYYVALVCEGEVALLLGDCKKEAYKRTKSRPSLADATLVCKRENVFGRKSFSTRVRFGEGGRKEHDVVVESSVPSPGGSAARGLAPAEMSISVDGTVMIHVSNLQWKFRGNQTVVVERVPVQVFWDAHGWLFGDGGGSNGSTAGGLSHAVFAFKPGAPPELAVPETDRQHGGGGRDDGSGGGSSSGGSDPETASRVRGCRMVPEFCFFLYAWKME